MKTIIRTIAIAALVLFSFNAHAVMIQWVPGSGDSLTSVGGHRILQYSDVEWDTLGGYSPGDPSGIVGTWGVNCSAPTCLFDGSTSQLWLRDGAGLTASTTFSVASDAVAFMMDGDFNDGLADFLVDGTAVLSGHDMYNWGHQTLLVTGLPYGIHTVGVVHRDLAGPNRTLTDVAIFGAAAIPEPATLALMGLGLAGLGFARSRRTG